MNYYGTVMSSWFKTTDSDKLKEMINNLSSSSGVEIFYDKESDEYSFASEDADLYYDSKDDEDYDDLEYFYEELSTIIADGSYCIVTETGSEGLRYNYAGATIITKNKVEFISLQSIAVERAKKMLGK